MATDNKISTLVESQVPSYLLDDGPNLVAFLKAYYEYLEQTNKPTDRLKNLLNYNDIDDTLEEFITFFQREVLTGFPERTLGDKRKLIKNIKDLYLTKGSEQSYKLLFRLLFNEEIEFFYPGEEILRASDGRWVKENVLLIGFPFSGDVASAGGRRVVGQTSGAEARVTRVTSTFTSGIEVFELVLDNITGTFIDNELISTPAGDITGTIVSSVGPLQRVVIQVGGSGHQGGDLVNFTSDSGSAATGQINRITDTAITFNIVDGGSGYTTSANVQVLSDTGIGADFEITSLSNTEIIPFFNDIINPLRNVPLDTGPTFVSGGANTSAVSASLAAANVSSTLVSALDVSNTVVGTINSISTTSQGSGYQTLPTVIVTEDAVFRQKIPDGSGGFKGKNAVIGTTNVPGSILDVTVTEPGSGYNRSDQVTISNTTRSGTTAATGAPIVSGVIEFPGKYIDTKGFLSWNMKLQDNFFYQEYSYLIQSETVVNAYRDFVLKTIHPAGTKLFGEVLITDQVSQSVTVQNDTTVSIHAILDQDIFIPTVVSLSEQDYIDNVIQPEPEIEFGPALDLFLFTPTTTVVSNVTILKYGNINVESINTFNTQALSSTLIQTFASNTVLQFSSNTFNTTVDLPKVNQPIVEHS